MERQGALFSWLIFLPGDGIPWQSLRRSVATHQFTSLEPPKKKKKINCSSINRSHYNFILLSPDCCMSIASKSVSNPRHVFAKNSSLLKHKPNSKVSSWDPLYHPDLVDVTNFSVVLLNHRSTACQLLMLRISRNNENALKRNQHGFMERYLHCLFLHKSVNLVISPCHRSS